MQIPGHRDRQEGISGSFLAVGTPRWLFLWGLGEAEMHTEISRLVQKLVIPSEN